MKDRPCLQQGWVWARVSDVGEVKLGRQRSPQHHNGDHMRPYLRVANVFEDRIDVSSVLQMNFTPDEYETYKLLPGDVLLNEGQSLELVGRPALYQGEVAGACFQNTLIRFRAGEAVLPKYAVLVFRWYLHSGRFQSIAKWTTNIAHLGAQRLADLPFPVAPPAEQRRIVAEIETQFTRLETGLAALRRSQRQIAKCRASVLASAVTGRLERGRRQAQEWPWVPVADLAEHSPNAITDGPFGSNLKTSHYVENGPRVVRLQNIGECRFIDERACISEEHFASLQKHRVLAGDVLIAALGNELPRACLAPDDLGPAIVKADCVRCRPSTERVSARYLCYALNSFPVRLATRQLVHGVGRPRLNLSEIKSIRIPLPSLAEQAEIVATVEDRFSLLDKADSIIQASILRGARLRQAILKRAFEGRLVPQDPNDEPAEILLSPVSSNGHSNRGRRAAVEGK